MGTSISQIITVRTPVLGTAPGAATGLTVSSLSTTSLTLSWTAPNIGSTPLTYQPQIALNGSTAWTNIGAGTSVATVAVVGLTPNAAYQFEVVTSNISGSTISAAINATTLSVSAGAPSGLALIGSPTQTNVTLQWNQPPTGTLPFSYQVSYATPSGTPVFTAFSASTTALTQTITGLTAGSTYDFRVAAANGAGAGPASFILANVQTASASSNQAPSAPINLAAGNITATSLDVSWTAPATGASPISYIVQYRLH